MTVYVDDSRIPARVGRLNARWSHLIADSQDELHEFAAKLGLRREWFQPGKPRGEGSHSPHWHYDVTETKRLQAIRLGARAVAWRDTPAIIRSRDERAAAASVEGPRALADLASDGARRAWEAGNLVQAARLTRSCRDLDADRADLWQRWHEQFAAAADQADLSTQTAVRLALAGIAPDDPALLRIREHNRVLGAGPAQTEVGQ